MKYLRKFKTLSDYTEYMNNGGLIPNVSLITDFFEVKTTKFEFPLLTATFNATSSDKIGLKKLTGFKRVVVDDVEIDITDKTNYIFDTEGIHIVKVYFDNNATIPSGVFDELEILTDITLQGNFKEISNDAFRSCSSLKTVALNKSLQTIGQAAFFSCTELTSIIIPDSVTSIGGWVFSGCKNLTSITMGKNVSSIGDYAFEQTNLVGDLAFYGKDIEIGMSAFISCSGLTSIEFFNSVSNIGNNAFRDCKGLTSIEFFNSVSNIGNNAFSYCTGLTSITMGKNVSSIGDYAFDYCKGLTLINIPGSVTSIGNYAFHYCTGLVDVVIGSGVTSIGNGTFNGCTELTSINIPDSVTSIGGDAFYGCKGLTSIIIPDSVTSIYNGTFQNTGLVDVVIGSGVTKIGSFAFDSCSSLTSINIPDSVSNIGHNAFRYCSSLTSINIPDSVTSIGNGTFNGCTELTSINIPDSVSNIGHNAFCYCSSLVDVVIGSGVTSIGDLAFYDCSGLETIYSYALTAPTINSTTFSWVKNNGTLYYPAGSDYSSWLKTDERYLGYHKWTGVPMMRLDGYDIAVMVVSNESGETIITNNTNAFSEMSINGSVLNSPVTTYSFDKPNAEYVVRFKVNENGLYDFKNCKSLKTVLVGGSLNKICANAFQGCTGLKNVEMTVSVTSIGEKAFYGCTGLTEFEIGDSITSIGEGAFQGISNVVISSGNTTYVSVENSNTIIEIATNKLLYGKNNSFIPDSVTSIGGWAFEGCTGLTSIIIPDSVTSIGEGAFNNCTGLETIYSYALTAPTINSAAFNGIKSNGTLYYATGSDYSSWLKTDEGYLGYHEWAGVPMAGLGDIVYWNNNRLYSIEYSKWSSSRGTAVGVIVVPTDFAPDKRPRMISMKYVDINGNPTANYTSGAWGPVMDVLTIDNRRYVPVNSNNGSESYGYSSSGYFPSDAFTNGVPSVLDSGATYNEVTVTGGSIYCPSAFKLDSEGKIVKNDKYFVSLTSSSYPGELNVLTDFNGKENTQELSSNVNCVAANMAWKYNDGVTGLQYHLPSAGEIGCLMCRLELINTSLDRIYALRMVPDYFWTSTEKDSTYAVCLNVDKGQMGSNTKTGTCFVRPFAVLS